MLKNFLQDNSIQNKTARTIYEFIYHYGPLTQGRLCEMTKLKRLKVTRILDELKEQSFIQKAGFDSSTGGRPPTVYKVNSKSGYIISIHITRTSTRITLFDILLKPLSEKFFHMTKVHTPLFVMKEIISTINSFMQSYQFNTDELLGIGVAAVGPFDRENGVILEPKQFLAKGWENLAIVDMIKEHFPVKVFLENAPSVTALGEYKYLQESHKNILFCLNGWLFACGIITDGKMVRLESGDASGYGHMIIEANGKQCLCGSRGCVVAYSSLRTILDQIKEKDISFYSQLKEAEGYIAIDKMMSLISKKKELNNIINDSAYYYGIGVASLQNIFQSSAVILGGPLVEYLPDYYEKTVQTAEKYISIGKDNVTFRKEKEKTTVEGAAMVVLNTYIGI